MVIGRMAAFAAAAFLLMTKQLKAGRLGIPRGMPLARMIGICAFWPENRVRRGIFGVPDHA